MECLVTIDEKAHLEWKVDTFDKERRWGNHSFVTSISFFKNIISTNVI